MRERLEGELENVLRCGQIKWRKLIISFYACLMHCKFEICQGRDQVAAKTRSQPSCKLNVDNCIRTKFSRKWADDVERWVHPELK